MGVAVPVLLPAPLPKMAQVNWVGERPEACTTQTLLFRKAPAPVEVDTVPLVETEPKVLLLAISN